MSDRKAETLAKVKSYRAELERATKAQGVAKRRLHEWITKAVDAGVSSAEVARVAGVSAGRVSQIAPVAKAPEPRSQAGKEGAPSSCVNDPATVPAIPDTPAMLSGVASTRRRSPYGRPTMFYDVRTGEAVTDEGYRVAHAGGLEPGSIAHILYLASDVAHRQAGQACGRVYLVGPTPLDPSSGATQAEQVRAWALGEPGFGWTAGEHYLADPTLPVLRFTGPRQNERVTILRAASWWGESDAPAEVCAAAWRGLGMALDRVPAFAGAGLADTPATTGRALWLRTIPEGRNYPVLSAELRELIGATSGQGRIELRPEPTTFSLRPGEAEWVGRERFTYLDGRFMYAALTWGMPVGEPRRWTAAEIEAADARTFTAAIRGRGRWRITCEVPAGWAHVGMLMAPDDAGGWCYPSTPGQVFTTWADGSEVWAAMEHGWNPAFHEALTWAEGKPLDSWRDALVGVWEQAQANGTPAGQLGARAVRSILLYALGAFAARSHPITRTVPADQAGAVPAGVEVRRVGDHLMWTEPAKVSAWSEQTAHPEWSATVWARARTRLLTGRGVGQERVGALHLPADRVVAFSTDALYVAGGDPGWADDGKPGRFRTKGTRPGAFAWPATRAELYRLRDEAEHGE